MIKDYTIFLNGVDDNKRKFHYSLNSDTPQDVIIKVYDTFFNFVCYQNSTNLIPNVNYWIYVPNDEKNKYVEFIDANTSQTVGLFGLGGTIDFNSIMNNIPNNKYIKNILKTENDNESISFIFKEIFFSKIYNNDFVCVDENDIVIDIGFNYGLFALDSLTYKPKKIIGFEPNPNLVKLFNQLNINSVELHEAAVSDKKGKTVFYQGKNSIQSSIISELSYNYDTTTSYEVNVLSFNDIIEQYDIINYLKVDCEGSEYEIFNSIPNNILSTKIKKIALEFHNNVNDIKVVNLISKIKECGFEIKIEDFNTIGMLYAKKL
jgi:hypothetical protein